MAIGREFARAELGDKRLEARLVRLSELLAKQPDASFPTALKEADLEAAYRFLNNERVTPERILEPHFRASAERAKALRTVIVPHDTTELSYSTGREDLGWLNSGGHGLLAHVAIGISADGRREPIGVLGLHTWVRRGTPKSAQGLTRRQRNLATERESDRWTTLVDGVSELLGSEVEAIHVMDREADSFALLAALTKNGRRFVVRSRGDRRIERDGASTLELALENLEGQFCRRVELSRRIRPDIPRRQMPPRDERTAKLVVAAGRFSVRRPDNAPFVPAKTVSIGVVHVRESDPPDGCAPVEWVLLTSEPIETAEQIERVVDAYRTRWCIEEFFKSLKTGCGIEKRQIETLHGLSNALAVFLPIAWDLFRLRTIARDDERAPAKTVLNELQLRLLKLETGIDLKRATARDAMLAVARLGGHLRRNGDPGWQVLGRGYERLVTLEHGARLALAGEGSDQS